MNLGVPSKEAQGTVYRSHSHQKAGEVAKESTSFRHLNERLASLIMDRACVCVCLYTKLTSENFKSSTETWRIFVETLSLWSISLILHNNYSKVAEFVQCRQTSCLIVRRSEKRHVCVWSSLKCRIAKMTNWP